MYALGECCVFRYRLIDHWFNTKHRDLYYSFLTWFEEDESSLFEDTYSFEFSDEIMQNLNNTMLKDGCIYQSLLKLWQEDDISALTKEKILKDVTKAVRDKWVNILFCIHISVNINWKEFAKIPDNTTRVNSVQEPKNVDELNTYAWRLENSSCFMKFDHKLQEL